MVLDYVLHVSWLKVSRILSKDVEFIRRLNTIFLGKASDSGAIAPC